MTKRIVCIGPTKSTKAIATEGTNGSLKKLNIIGVCSEEDRDRHAGTVNLTMFQTIKAVVMTAVGKEYID